jgi:hypothetical protein
MRKLLILCLVLASCSVTHIKYSSETPQFFACNRWVDRNNDGIYDYYEFENIKNTFHSSENVLFVGFFKALPAGSKLHFQLFAPDGVLVYEFTQPTLFKRTLLRAEYSVMELIAKKSTGIWDAVWELEDDIIAETQVNLLQ